MSKGKKENKVLHPECTAVTVVLALGTPDMTMPTPSGRSNAAYSCKHVCLPKAPGA